MQRSQLADLILWLHHKAENEQRIKTTRDKEAAEFLDGLQNGTGTSEVGIEIHQGRIISAEAKRMQRYALRHLQKMPVVLAHLDAFGYTALTVRAILQHHYFNLRTAPLGSIEWCVWLDLSTALTKVSDRAALTARLTILGESTSAIEDKLGTNGARWLRQSTQEIARYLNKRKG